MRVNCKLWHSDNSKHVKKAVETLTTSVDEGEREVQQAGETLVATLHPWTLPKCITIQWECKLKRELVSFKQNRVGILTEIAIREGLENRDNGFRPLGGYPGPHPGPFSRNFLVTKKILRIWGDPPHSGPKLPLRRSIYFSCNLFNFACYIGYLYSKKCVR